ncbi:hypothetical protein X797_010478 [Metarhizium robertsii]|uniref:Major facilitator superfamily MFS-1 n=2 Tax=Metarhizium robertsii TaxID=568076 RepID=E9FB77_METRA|nr:major facilitator superfamily MFS-1 [Metarhizium robertsii ARSEF 23]EFY95077.1 major facilitator superfamily MFS-1 [Metarhizium robertsii ARSEF 23]EXU96517.1 hypothetical protein X797_010478 [Metarhizium robertsii]
MAKTYIPLPNFSTAPPPQGPLDLGHIVKTLSPGDFPAPLNRKSRVTIDADDLQPLDTKHGYRTTRKELLSGNFGVWAQLASVFGVGIEGGVTYERSADDVVTVDRLETSTFIPTQAYIKQALSSPPVQLYLSVTKRAKPVYLITGLKVACGVSLESQRSVTKGARLKLGFAPQGVPADGGPDVGVERMREEGFSFTGSSDFVMAARVEKITVDNKGGGEAKTKLYLKGASMEDADETREEGGLELGVGDVSEDELAGLAAEFQATKFVRWDNANLGEDMWMIPAGLDG